VKSKTIITADDHPLLLKGLNDFLTEKGYQLIGSATDGQMAYEMIKLKKPDIAVLDIQMPKLSGLAIAKKCFKEKLDTKIILITFHKEASLYFEAQELKIYGYLLKDFAMEEIEHCLASVIEGIPFLSKKIKETLELNSPKNAKLKQLTPSERKILKYIAKDKTNKEIAELLFISPRTVEKHRSNIILKLELEPKTNSLLIWAKENQDKFAI